VRHGSPAAGRHEDRRGLPAAGVAPVGLGRVQAAARRRCSGPAARSKAWAIAGHTSGEAIMFACAEKCSPAWWPGVGDAALARVRRHPALRVDHRHLPVAGLLVRGHGAVERLLRRGALLQQVQDARPVGRVDDGLRGHRPTPARTHGTTGPTANQWDWTATPTAPVAGSKPTMEYVPRRTIAPSYEGPAGRRRPAHPGNLPRP
jgi:hypothetical protein